LPVFLLGLLIFLQSLVSRCRALAEANWCVFRFLSYNLAMFCSCAVALEAYSHPFIRSGTNAGDNSLS